ncbi:U-exon [Odocoileus adenovirus 1]|uniref:U-exon n=2 Tax=Deer atadenovirus A TaxID=2169706 RepID=A0A515MFT0_9ADEN|nr:U-exon [Odocoileus adenovirus 1]QDM55330.1 U-exon [Deer atadenovirus A]ASU50484.1 U-exon [Odocoileus adenovirus 1]ASU50511.1 U-exon [Odocoileus adenovirus 1]ASU50538.1 U-exon [Odocoileus adenovirus 1]ASU50565.1 U-exon [Odocoileus adenovirus 1]
MTQVYFNYKLLVKCDFFCPTFKWIKISSVTGLKLENYGSLLLFYGDERKRDKLV